MKIRKGERVLFSAGNRGAARKGGGVSFVGALLVFFVVYPFGLSRSTAPAFAAAIGLAVLGAGFYAFSFTPLSYEDVAITDRALYVGSSRYDKGLLASASEDGRAILVQLKGGKRLKFVVRDRPAFLKAWSERSGA